MEEKIMIEFTGKELDEIMLYQKLAGADTVQHAIMNAISIALDTKDQ